MEKERLTEWIHGVGDEPDKAVPRMSLKNNGHKRCTDKLARYEDLEEACLKITGTDFDSMIGEFAHYCNLQRQGKILELQCAVGDTVYFPDEDNDYIYPLKVSDIVISDTGEAPCIQYTCAFFNGWGDVENEFYFDNNDFGITVFLTQEEAGTKLAEMKSLCGYPVKYFWGKTKFCPECGANMRISLDDYEMEKLWEEFGDVPLNADECLDVDWLDFKKGTHREDIWLWFDLNHSKGVAWLMNEYEG